MAASNAQAVAGIIKATNNDPLLTPQEAAAYLGVAEQSLANWRTTGRYQLTFVRVGTRMIRYRKSDLDAFIASGASTPSED